MSFGSRVSKKYHLFNVLMIFLKKSWGTCSLNKNRIIVFKIRLLQRIGGNLLPKNKENSM